VKSFTAEIKYLQQKNSCDENAVVYKAYLIYLTNERVRGIESFHCELIHGKQKKLDLAPIFAQNSSSGARLPHE